MQAINNIPGKRDPLLMAREKGAQRPRRPQFTGSPAYPRRPVHAWPIIRDREPDQETHWSHVQLAPLARRPQQAKLWTARPLFQA